MTFVDEEKLKKQFDKNFKKFCEICNSNLPDRTKKEAVKSIIFKVQHSKKATVIQKFFILILQILLGITINYLVFFNPNNYIPLPIAFTIAFNLSLFIIIVEYFS